MNRKSAGLEPKSPPPVKANQERTATALREAGAVMLPIAQWLLRSGVPYGAFADLLKAVFVHAARLELQRSDAKATHSALSVMSGVHRKDVRALAEADVEPAPPRRSISLASQVFARWLTDPRYRDRAGKPRRLPRSGSGRSFESLSRELSSDVHPRTVLEELTRLGLVEVHDDSVVPASRSFAPSRELDEATALFAANTADHLAAGVHNLTTDATRFLEQSIFATGLSEASVEQLHDAARSVWASAFDTMMEQGRRCIEADGDEAHGFRMRFGVYYFSESAPDQTGAPDAAAPPSRAQAKAPASPAAPTPRRAPRPRKTP
jgi:hypothetical protein